MQTTLIILKPDAVQRGITGRILSRFEDKGFHVIGARMTRISRELAEKHYAPHQGKPFYPALIRYMTSSPVLVLALRGNNAIDVSRRMMGATFGHKAEPGTIRGDFGLSNTFNLIHGSDSAESAARELALFFKPDELFDQTRTLDQWVYDLSSGKPE